MDPRHALTAIRALGAALTGYDNAMTRSQAFTLTMLATSHFRHCNLDIGIQIGHRAVTVAGQVSSQRSMTG